MEFANRVLHRTARLLIVTHCCTSFTDLVASSVSRFNLRVTFACALAALSGCGTVLEGQRQNDTIIACPHVPGTQPRQQTVDVRSLQLYINAKGNLVDPVTSNDIAQSDEPAYVERMFEGL